MTPARFLRPFRLLVPDLGEVGARERLRASVGAMLGLAITGFVSRLALGPVEGLPLLIAPMGASAVLLFAVPSSPLAQPWSILGGNIVAALIGVTAARLVDDPIAAAAAAGAVSIAAMMMLRCLHPPSGAVALTAVLGGQAVHATGYGFAIWPVGLNSALLLAVALAFNNATGRRYPHPLRMRASLPANEAAVTAVLHRHDEVVDIGRKDLASLVTEIESELLTRQDRRCADLIRSSTDVLAAELPLDEALDEMMERNRATMPVVEAGRFVGMVGQGDLVRHLRPTRTGRRVARVFQRSLRFDLAPRIVGALARRGAAVATPAMPIGDVFSLVAAQEADLPVVDAEGRLVGLLTQADLLRWAARAAAARRA